MQVLNRGMHEVLLATLVVILAKDVLAQQPLTTEGTAATTKKEEVEANLSLEQIKNLPCIEIKPLGRGLTKVVIRKSGHYCITEDLHARVEWADQRAELSMIDITAGNIVLDLQGHTLGRGRIFKNPGDTGIEITDPQEFLKGTGFAKNIVIRNGVLQDFATGIYFAYGRSRFLDPPTFDPATNTYHFPANNITLENITFKNNKKDFDIRLPDNPNK